MPSFWTDRKVAVTGATGLLGSHLTAELVDRGADVVVLQRDEVATSPIVSSWWDSVAVVRGDIEDQRVLERMFAEYEVRTAFHLAAQSQVGVANASPVSTFESNIRGTWCLLEAARRSPRLEQVVVASSDKAYGAQPNLPYDEDMPLSAIHPYDVSKACADQLCTTYHRTWGTPVSITRCGNFFGPGDRNWERLVPGTIRLLLRGERPLIRSDGTLTRDYLYVVDGARAYLALAEAMADDPSHIGEAFNFSTERPLTVLELVGLLQDALGTDLEPDIRNEASHEIPAQYLSAAKARKRLGWQPDWTIEDALGETVAWYRQWLAGGDGAGS